KGHRYTMKRILDTRSEYFKEHVIPETKRIVALLLSTFVFTVGVLWFLEASEVPLYTGGITGIAQLIRDALYILSGNDLGTDFIALFVLLINVPILIVGWFGVSHRFTVYSVVSVLIQTAIFAWMPTIDMGLEGVEHALAASVIGGFLIGLGSGGALKYGTSLGGIDILAQYLSFRNQKSVGIIMMAINVAIALIGAILLGGVAGPSGQIVAGGVIISYTLIRIIITTIATDKVHTAYLFLSVDIITETPDDLVEQILKVIHRGVTLIAAKGAYSQHDKTIVSVIISTYELHRIVELVRRVDPGAFMTTRPVKGVVGNFKRKTIA
ncbi:MAG: YitT family protein, partial [Acholeplasmataceae bacterium]